ncbi:hypothetical protein ACQZV8_19050 [Magnetococcales bacterium HHB-1]
MKRRSKPRKSFPPCSRCGANTGFNWSCDCGFAVCHKCMNENMAEYISNGRQWSCPQCGTTHIGANR